MSLTQPQQDAIAKVRRVRRRTNRVTPAVTAVTFVLFVASYLVPNPVGDVLAVAAGVIIVVEFFIELTWFSRAAQRVDEAFPEEAEHERVDA